MTKSVGLFLKLMILGGLSLVILLALFLVSGVITDRKSYRDQAVQSIGQSYAGPQTLLGPVLVQPYRSSEPVEKLDDKGVKHIEMRQVDSNDVVYPTELSMQGVLKPSVRRHGLYRVPVYEFEGKLLGSLLLFGLIALVMVVTRRVDWYATTTEVVAKPAGTQP